MVVEEDSEEEVTANFCFPASNAALFFALFSDPFDAISSLLLLLISFSSSLLLLF